MKRVKGGKWQVASCQVPATCHFSLIPILLFEGIYDLLIGAGKGVVGEVFQRHPSMIGNAKVLDDAATINGVVSVERDAKVGIGVLDTDQKLADANVNI